MVQKVNKKPADLDDELGPDNEAAEAKAKAEKEAKEAEEAQAAADKKEAEAAEAKAKAEKEAKEAEEAQAAAEAAEAKAKAEKEAKEAEEAAEVKAKAKSVPVLLLRDYWDEDGTRHKKGASVKLTVTEAKALIAGKKAERNDPLPGEED